MTVIQPIQPRVSSPVMVKRPRFAAEEPQQPGAPKAVTVKAPSGRWILPTFLLAFLGGSFYQGHLANSPVGQANKRLAYANVGVNQVATGKLGNDSFLNTARQQTIAAYFRTTMREIAGYNDNMLYNEVKKIIPEAGLTQQEEAYTLNLLEDITKNKTEIAADYETYNKWLDAVAANHVTPEALSSLKAESKKFWDDSQSNQRQQALAGMLPLLIIGVGFLAHMGLTAAAVRKAVKEHQNNQTNG